MGAYKKLLAQGPYPIWVLFLMLFAYLLNQLDRYIIVVVSKSEGYEYGILTGPAFTVVYTFAGLPIGLVADKYNRKNILAFAVLWWSGFTALSGLATEFWQRLLARAGLGLGEAACTPLAQGILADYFAPELRATANGIYNWGIYTGYSFAQGLVGYLNDDLGEAWSYYICAMPGVLCAALIFATVKEPQRGRLDAKPDDDAIQVASDTKPIVEKFTLWQTFMFFLRATSLMLLCFAGSVRNGAGTVWATYTRPFYLNYRHRPNDEVSLYMLWIPLVGGSLGAVMGGFISDRVVKNRGAHARVWVLVISQLVAAPFALGALLLPAPYCYLMLIGSNVFGEMWVGVSLTIVVELVPLAMRVTAVALYLFIISNVASLMLLIDPHKKHPRLLNLILLYPGCYALSALMWLVTLSSLNRDFRRRDKLIQDMESNTPLLYGTNGSVFEDPDNEM